jgi:hypothetical protein
MIQLRTGKVHREVFPIPLRMPWWRAGSGGLKSTLPFKMTDLTKSCPSPKRNSMLNLFFKFIYDWESFERKKFAWNALLIEGLDHWPFGLKD